LLIAEVEGHSECSSSSVDTLNYITPTLTHHFI
jgi:hypothetical protein